MKDNILYGLGVIAFFFIAVIGVVLLWGWSEANNDVRCREVYGSQANGRTGYHGSPQCVMPDGTGKYL